MTPDIPFIKDGAEYRVVCNEGLSINGTSRVTCFLGILSEPPTCVEGAGPYAGLYSLPSLLLFKSKPFSFACTTCLSVNCLGTSLDVYMVFVFKN